MKHVADTEIRAEVRSLLVRNRVDLWRLQVRVTSGTVRISGELSYLDGVHLPVPTAAVESLERDVATSPGVKHAFFDLANWSRLSTGEWQAVEHAGEPALAA